MAHWNTYIGHQSHHPQHGQSFSDAATTEDVLIKFSKDLPPRIQRLPSCDSIPTTQYCGDWNVSIIDILWSFERKHDRLI